MLSLVHNCHILVPFHSVNNYKRNQKSLNFMQPSAMDSIVVNLDSRFEFSIFFPHPTFPLLTFDVQFLQQLRKRLRNMVTSKIFPCTFLLLKSDASLAYDVFMLCKLKTIQDSKPNVPKNSILCIISL